LISSQCITFILSLFHLWVITTVDYLDINKLDFKNANHVGKIEVKIPA
jgi:hypothetical protein